MTKKQSFLPPIEFSRDALMDDIETRDKILRENVVPCVFCFWRVSKRIQQYRELRQIF